jgi:hypothetical protein
MKMTRDQLTLAVEKVASATDKTASEILTKLLNKDHWTWFLIEEAAKR